MRRLLITATIALAAVIYIIPKETTLADVVAPAKQSTHLKTVPGFRIEKLYTVPKKDPGSWVSLAVDGKRRLITSDQYGSLYRVTPPAIGGKPSDIQVQKLKVKMGSAHGLLVAYDSLYVVVGESRSNPGVYRLRDTDGDDEYDSIKVIRKLKGRGEHGPHSIIKGPDGKIYFCAGNHTDLPYVPRSVVPRNWKEDYLLGRQWDARGHARGTRAPGGWICRMDPDGKKMELVSIGYRNQFDIAFNTEGELFTYDADMEWDIGAPWYRPTRICHVTSGSEWGWRSGTGKWPVYFPDTLPPVVDIGPGSPTGIVFGTSAKFPAQYQKALFI